MSLATNPYISGTHLRPSTTTEIMVVLQFPSAQPELDYSEGKVGKADREVKNLDNSKLIDNLWVAF